MRQVDTILARFRGPVTLTPSRLKLLGGFALCAGFTAFSVYLLLRAIEDWSSEVASISSASADTGTMTFAAALIACPSVA